MTVIKSLNRWQAALLLFAAGALMAAGFAPYHAWPVIFISLPIAYWLFGNASSYAQAAWRGFYFGYGHAIAGTWWIANALLVDADKFAWLFPFSVLGLSAVMALWFVVLALAVHAARRHSSIALFAALWVLVELARSFGMFGFPWNLLGTMGLASLPFAQMAALFGTYGLSLVLVLLGLLPVLWLGALSNRRKILYTLAGISLVLAVHTHGAMRLQMPMDYTQTLLRVVQPNIAQSLKGSKQAQRQTIETLAYLSTQAAERLPDVTIWPETAYPFTVRVGEQYGLPAAKRLITGAVRAGGTGTSVQLWNSIVVMNPEGELLSTYDKHQLVPFGEFVPLRHVLPLDKITPGALDFSRGSGPQTLRIEGLPPFSPLVCYEGIFPAMATHNDDRPEWMLNLTNDGWYGDTAGPHQHLSMVRMRAIEQGLPMVRAANSGISAVFDSYGRIAGALPLHEQGVMDVYLPAAHAKTVYATYGDWLVLSLIGIILMATTVSHRLRQ